MPRVVKSVEACGTVNHMAAAVYTHSSRSSSSDGRNLQGRAVMA
jgi:hypothetical protein